VDEALALIDRFSRRAVYSFAALLVVLTDLLDWATGETISVSFFYMLPILIATWKGGLVPGLVVNGLCAVMRLLVVIKWEGPDLLREPALYWNLIVEGVFFITLTLIGAALRDLNARQSLLARTDSLTGLANRRAFYERAELELSRFRRFQEELTLAYVDVDNFKVVNDELGHEAGDDLLRNVAATFLRRVRATDLVARLGGDEFALLLSGTPAAAARTLLAELSGTLADEMTRQSWPVTFSIGAVTFLRPPASADEMLRRVDELMYRVKREGKAGIRHAVFPEMPGDRGEKSSAPLAASP
jgi:diguanylate cyclase (GGDEF)-like protein